MSEESWSSQRYDREARKLYEAGRWDGARRLLRRGVLEHPDSLVLRISLGYAELACEEYAWARRVFEGVLEIDPQNQDALVGMGEALLKLDRARAFATFDGLTRDVDVDPEVELAVGRALYREGLHGRALPCFQRALGAEERADAAAEIAYTLYNLGRADEAMPYLRRALEVDPEHHEARAFLGSLLYEAGDMKEALQTLGAVPPAAFWDALALWRTVELLRSLQGVPEDAPSLAPYLERLSELSQRATPEDRLLAELEARPDDSDPGQLDLFGLPQRPAHVVHASDGLVYTGDWEAIVIAMRDHGPDPRMSVKEFMQATARSIERARGVRVPDDDPESFIRASERAGALRIGR